MKKNKEMIKELNELNEIFLKFMKVDLVELRFFQLTNNLKDDEIRITELIRKLDEEYYMSYVYNFFYGYFNGFTPELKYNYKIPKKIETCLKLQIDRIERLIYNIGKKYEKLLYNKSNVDKMVRILFNHRKKEFEEFNDIIFESQNIFLIYN